VFQSGSLTNSISLEEEDSEISSLLIDSNQTTAIIPLKNQSATPKRVRRNRKKLPPKSVAHLPAIRILKCDPRRRYAEMVMKVINNYDVSIMDAFLHDFCSPDFRFTEIIPMIANEPDQPPNCIDGLENIIKSWAYCFEIMPDCVFHLSEAKFVRTLGQENTRVVCKARLTGTKLYKAKNPLIEKKKKIMTSNIHNAINSSSPEYSVMQQICAVGNYLKHLHLKPEHKHEEKEIESSVIDFSQDEYFKTVHGMKEVIQLSLLEKPVRVYVEGIFEFHLDQYHRFTK
jgi:hypothetical protein